MTGRLGNLTSGTCLTLLLLLGASALVSACNTIEGAGRDIEAAGDAITDSADDTEEEIE